MLVRTAERPVGEGFAHMVRKVFFMLPLASLGRRIVILGPSNAGKSTLAVAIGQRLDLPVVHLDRLCHLPHTDWVPRPEAEFAALHDAAILGDAWVIEGNYSRLMPQRMARATGAILLDSNRWFRLGRYVRRTVVNRADRMGHLEGAQDSLKWGMVDWIVIRTPRSAVKYATMIREAGVPAVECHGVRALRAAYREWGLEVPR